MFETADFGTILIQPWELLALPFYLLVIYLIASRIRKNRIDQNPLYRFYVTGLFAKIAGGIGLALVYVYIYKGGDTTGYFESSVSMKNLLMASPADWFLNEFGGNTNEHFSLFTWSTGYPYEYMYFDPKTYMVIRLVNPLLLFSFNSYILTTVLLDWIAYSGMWRLFLVFSSYYPNRKNLFAFAILFFPSVLFWGSGILKDCITLACTGWVVYCIHKVFFIKQNRLLYIALLITNLLIIFFIKPYIIFVLFPGSLMWIFASRISKIRNTAFKVLVIPFIVVFCVGGAIYSLSFFGQSMGKFSLEKITNTVLVTQNDLKQSYYQGHSFDIGLDDATPTGLLKKLPAALTAGLFRPFLWESGNAQMIISGLENTLILILTIICLFSILKNVIQFFKKLLQEPLLFFSISFSLFFAFSVGISTSNFGALVRFKIAYLPFFLCSLFILMKRKDDLVELASNTRQMITAQ